MSFKFLSEHVSVDLIAQLSDDELGILCSENNFNPHFSLDIQKAIFARIKTRYENTPFSFDNSLNFEYHDYEYFFALNRDLAPELLSALAKFGSDAVIVAVAANPSTPVEALAYLVQEDKLYDFGTAASILDNPSCNGQLALEIGQKNTEVGCLGDDVDYALSTCSALSDVDIRILVTKHWISETYYENLLAHPNIADETKSLINELIIQISSN